MVHTHLSELFKGLLVLNCPYHERWLWCNSPVYTLFMYLPSLVVIGKTSFHPELLVSLRRIAILETNKLKLLVFSFIRDR